ncbi:MAG: xanthine dehydrogenase family protein molybdopterin-binding subunit, partial [Dehalococcoidia bacterium]
HARINSIDVTSAEALPGVVAVVTRADFPSLTPGSEAAFGTITAREQYLSQEVIARDKALFNGHAVAAVAATSAAVAEKALALIEVDYEVLPFAMDPEEATKPEATLLHGDLYTRSKDGMSETPSNVAEHLEMGRGDVERGFAEADVVMDRTFRSQVVHHGYIETDVETAEASSDGSVVVWANTQATYAQRHDLAVVLDIPLSKIKVIPTEVGGAFGGKESVRVAALCVALSRKAGLPVRIALARDEVLRGTGPGNALIATIKVGARRDGEITAIQARVQFDAGAFPGAPLRSAIRRVFSHYRTPNLKIDAYDVVTNKPHVAAYRAPGATPTAFALESVIDEVAEAVGLDPVSFRLKNVSRSGDPMPDGVRLSSVNFEELLNRVSSSPCWTQPLEGPNRGRGLALGMWTMPGGTTSCHLTLRACECIGVMLLEILWGD